MSERTFFELRSALPGFIFIIITLSLNPEFLIALFRFAESSASFGIFLGFITILGGSALGFLVSQIWWIIFERVFHGYYGCPRRKSVNLLIEKYCIKKDVADDVQKMLVILNFFIHYKTDEGILSYISRRWDLYNLHGSIFTTYLFSLLIGCVSREFIIKQQKIMTIKYNIIPSSYWILLILFFILIPIFCLNSMNWTMAQHERMIIALINKKNISREQLEIIFPEI